MPIAAPRIDSIAAVANAPTDERLPLLRRRLPGRRARRVALLRGDARRAQRQHRALQRGVRGPVTDARLAALRALLDEHSLDAILLSREREQALLQRLPARSRRGGDLRLRRDAARDARREPDPGRLALHRAGRDRGARLDARLHREVARRRAPAAAPPARDRGARHGGRRGQPRRLVGPGRGGARRRAARDGRRARPAADHQDAPRRSTPSVERAPSPMPASLTSSTSPAPA